MSRTLAIRFPALAILFAACLLATPAFAAPKKPAHVRKVQPAAAPAAKAPLLDSAKIRKFYMDGEFEAAIQILETGLREMRNFNHQDSVFIFKHLGVMYAARYETREKGKLYMHQLLMTEPTAKIMDMYASDMIYMIFKNMQDEFESNRMRLDRAELLVKGNEEANNPKSPARDTVRVAAQPASSSGKTWVWLGATAAVVGAGVGAYFMFSDEPKTVTNRKQF